MPTKSQARQTFSLAVRVLACVVSLTAAGNVLAQSPVCDRYRAELASLGRGSASSREASANARQYQAEIGRLVGYYRSIGCDRGGFFFRPPAECGPIAERIRALQVNYQAILSQAYADPYAVEVRRKQLRAAIDEICGGDASGSTEAAGGSSGGERLVCVRSCDGSYFPLDAEAKGRQSPQALCNALCPNAEVRVFRAPFEGGIENAKSERGEAYMKLPNALKYRQSHDPSCSCKKADESWAATLQKAERMIARKKSDVIVTEAISLKMSAPKLAKSKPKPDEAEIAQATQVSTQPAGLTDPETTGSIGKDPGTVQAGKIRVIAPHIIPVPIQ